MSAMYMANANVQSGLIYLFLHSLLHSPSLRLYAFRADRYDCRGIIIGRLRERAKASAACWEIVSVRIALPIDMKKLAKKDIRSELHK